MPVLHTNGPALFYLKVGEVLPCLVMHGGLGFDHTGMHPWLDPLGDAMRPAYYDHRDNTRLERPPLETLTYRVLVRRRLARAARPQGGRSTEPLLRRLHRLGVRVALPRAA
jgi:hypothetical protein